MQKFTEMWSRFKKEHFFIPFLIEVLSLRQKNPCFYQIKKDDLENNLVTKEENKEENFVIFKFRIQFI